jgi:hypothetical protein
MADRLDGSPGGRSALALLHWAAAVVRGGAGGRVTAIVWDRGPSGWFVPPELRVREVEAVNRWVLPRELVRLAPTRAIGRGLRQGRVRAWWALAGAEPAVVLADERRAELRHYIPPTSRMATGPDVISRELIGGLWRQALRTRFRIPDTALMVAGSGPPTWGSGVDQFVAAAVDPAVHDAHFIWFLPRSGSPPAEVLHDARALGVGDRLHWLAAPGEPADPVVGCDAFLAAGRSATSPAGLELPVVRYGTDAVPAAGARPEQLARALAAVDVTDRKVHEDAELAAAIGWAEPR